MKAEDIKVVCACGRSTVHSDSSWESDVTISELHSRPGWDTGFRDALGGGIEACWRMGRCRVKGVWSDTKKELPYP